jgi:hypothetical protein
MNRDLTYINFSCKGRYIFNKFSKNNESNIHYIIDYQFIFL